MNTTIIANSLLKKSFEEGISVNLLKLNYLVYLLYSDYLSKTGDKLFYESFINTAEGPTLLSLQAKFECFENKSIILFARDAVGNVKVICDDYLEERLSYIWNTYKNLSSTEILHFLDKSEIFLNKEDNEPLSDEEILEDEAKRNEKGLTKIKKH